jgi:hypothetical protein
MQRSVHLADTNGQIKTCRQSSGHGSGVWLDVKPKRSDRQYMGQRPGKSFRQDFLLSANDIYLKIE